MCKNLAIASDIAAVGQTFNALSYDSKHSAMTHHLLNKEQCAKCYTTVAILYCTADIAAVSPLFNAFNYDADWPENHTNHIPNAEGMRYVLGQSREQKLLIL